MAYTSTLEAGWVSLITAADIVGTDVEDIGQAISLRAEEEIYIAGTEHIRRREFTLGRHCAHAALDLLGFRNCTIARGRDGAPVWPAGVLGSITHTKGYAACLVAKKEHFGGVGIDAERVSEIPEEFAQRLFVPEERAYLADLDPRARKVAATIIFSAKESYYKASRASAVILSFRNLQVEFSGNVFSIYQLETKQRSETTGRFAVVGDLVLTSMSVPPVCSPRHF
jgi:4'-phosphopantetheinyl transferase EntD